MNSPYQQGPSGAWGAQDANSRVDKTGTCWDHFKRLTGVHEARRLGEKGVEGVILPDESDGEGLERQVWSKERQD